MPRKDSLKKPTNLIEVGSKTSTSIPRTQITELKPVLKKFQPSSNNHRSKSSIKPQGFEYSTTSPANKKSRSSVYSKHSGKNVYGFDDKSVKSENSEGNYSAGNFDSIFSAKNQKDNVKVCIRVRPLNQREKNGAGKNLCVTVDNGTVVLDRGYDTKKFHFDFVGEEDIPQQQIFNQIAKPIADSCMQGYNGTIFAYGQTGAGKTYTIQGPMINVDGGGEQMALQNGTNDLKGNRGIMQRSYEYIFQNIEAQRKLVEEKADGSELSFLIKCSYLEIYNEQIMDLLEPASINLQVREDIKKGVYVEGLQEDVVSSYRDMIHLIQKGSKNRHVGATSMNRESSRSHSVLTTIIESKSMSNTGVWNLKTSRFHIIDLAGSERSKNTNTVGERLKEAGMINKSLSALGNVINSLVDLSEGKNRHVPYRDSKLTFILRDSLGGNSKTVIIANISPSAINVGETLSTLEFAKRAKQIKNKAVVNEDSSGTILVLKTEIKRLKKDLMEQNKMHLAALSQQQTCRVCKSNMVMDSVDDQEQNPNEDSLLLDLDTSQQLTNRSNKKVQQQNDRIQHVEQLLCQNLENMTNQQKFYENELQNLKDQLNSANQAYEALNSQFSRDKMKMKLREDKIQKLEQEHGIDKDENVKILNEEIQVLKKQLEIEQKNPTKLMKIQADNLQLKEKVKQFEKDNSVDHMSLTKQLNDQIKLVEDLNGYIKEKCGIEAVQNSEKLSEQMDELQQQYDILLQQNVSAEETNQKLTREYGKSKVEIQQQNEQIENQIALLQEQSEQLSTLDQSYQNSQKETKINIEKMEKMQVKLIELIDNINSLETKIKDQNDEINQKDNDLKSLNEQLASSKDELSALSNDFQIQEEKCQLLENNIESFENQLKQKKQEFQMNNDEIQKQCEEIEQLQNDNQSLQQKITNGLQVIENLQNEINESKAKEKAQKDSMEKEVNELEQQIQRYVEQIEELTKEKQKQILKLKSDESSLKSQIVEKDNEISELQSKFETQIENKVKELYEFQLKLKDSDSKSQEQLSKKDAEFEKQTIHFESLIKKSSADYESQISSLKSELVAKSSEITFMASEIENINRQKDEERSYLDESIIDPMHKTLSEKESQISDLKEQLDAAKTLISEKNQVTAGQEQEVAENQVLLLEAQNLINQKVQECDELRKREEEIGLQLEESKLKNDKLEQHLKKKQEEIKSLENEKDNLQFKRDENTKNLEQKLKESKKRVSNLESENDCLQSELEKLKNGEMLSQHQKIDNLLEQLQEKSEKQANLLKEVSDMQVYIDELQDQLDAQKRQSSEVEKIKKDCYEKVKIVQEKSKICLSENTNIQIVKEGLTHLLAEISDFDQFSTDQSMEIKLLISQIVCEISRLYEKQLVLEKQKSSQDFKKYSEKYEKQKSDIKQMQQYHTTKMNEVSKQKQELEEQIENLKNQEPQEDPEKLKNDLKKYQTYLSEAEDLLQEVNIQNQNLKKEMFEMQQNLTTYESEILDLNKNLKNQKKMLSDQKQLYEVTVQSQEQEIEQHQYRYKDLENKMQKDMVNQEKKLLKVQDQVEMLAKSKSDHAYQQMQDLQQQVELVQQNDQEQQNQIQNLVHRVQKREMELAEAVKTLKSFSENNKNLQQENENLRWDIEQMAGHRNPNQKIQLHLKIKEENNKLREDNFRLQEDLAKKIEFIQKNAMFSPKQKSKELDTIINHILSCPQFEKLASQQNLNFDGSHSVQKIMEIITISDEILEEKQKVLPPRAPQQQQKQVYRSPAGPQDRVSGGQRGMQPKMMPSSASVQQIITNPTTYREHQSKAAMVSQQNQLSKSSRAGSHISNSSRNMLQQHMNNFTSEKPLANVFNSQASLGSPVMLNSYSSLYKNNLMRVANNSEQKQDASIQMRPEKENTLQHQMSQTQMLGGYAKKYRSRPESQTHMPENQKPRDSQQKNYK